MSYYSMNEITHELDLNNQISLLKRFELPNALLVTKIEYGNHSKNEMLECKNACCTVFVYFLNHRPASSFVFDNRSARIRFFCFDDFFDSVVSFMNHMVVGMKK